MYNKCKKYNIVDKNQVVSSILIKCFIIDFTQQEFSNLLPIQTTNKKSFKEGYCSKKKPYKVSPHQ